MRKLLIATVALLVLSGCHTSGYNPLKIERQESWRLTAGFERLLGLLTGCAD
jgi:Prokaryotic membrane lipoprotein lipid attachment site